MPNTTILSAAVNANFSDIATGLSDVLTRDGQAGMTAAFKAISGSSGAPSITFTADTKTGAYLPATGVLGLVANGLGLKINSEVFVAESAVATSGGSGYAVGDTLYGPTANAITPWVLTVATLSGSAIATVTVTVPGIYITKPSNPATPSSTSGIGTSATFTVTYNDPTSSDYKIGVTSQSDTQAWTELGSSSFVSGLMGLGNGFDFANGIGQFNLQRALGVASAPQASFKNLSVKVASTTTVTVAADSVVLKNASTSYFLAAPVSATCNLGTNGAVNTLDTGTIAVNTWYAIYVIAKTDGTGIGTLASTSATAPTLPTGYTFFGRIGWVQTINASATLYGTWQFGRSARYVVGLAQTTIVPNITNGVQGTYSDLSPTLVSVSLARFVPTTASIAKIIGAQYWGAHSQSNVLVAPSTAYGGTNMGPKGSAGNVFPIWLAGPTNAGNSTAMDILLESGSIAYAADASGGAISCYGWEDNI